MKKLKEAKPRDLTNEKNLQQDVFEIIEKIKIEGDAAVLSYNEKFDGSKRKDLRISKKEIEEAYALTEKDDPYFISDIKKAAANIKAFAQKQKETFTGIDEFSPMEGIKLGHRIIPLSSCCCYVPGGNYPLYSTALMLCIPAKTAGVERIAACSPPIKGSDKIAPKTIVALDTAGADEIYALGGAQAVAAFSYGTGQIKPVDLIAGPGNKYVTEAKRQCYGQVGIDFLAGPSEVLIIADEKAEAEIIAADILAQSEHDIMARGIALVTDERKGKEIIEAVERQLKALETADIAEKAWKDNGEVLVFDELEEIIEYANDHAPEHLEVFVADRDEKDLCEKLKNYGSLFVGRNAAEVFGDYATGTNHTLPTGRAARYTGGVWIGTFLKVCTHQRLTPKGMSDISDLVSRLAEGEGLLAHAKAARIRK